MEISIYISRSIFNHLPIAIELSTFNLPVHLFLVFNDFQSVATRNTFLVKKVRFVDLVGQEAGRVGRSQNTQDLLRVFRLFLRSY